MVEAKRGADTETNEWSEVDAMQIEHWDPERDGPLNEASMRRKLEDRGYTVSRYVYPPGTWFPDHDHRVDKIDGVLSGRFRMTMGGRSAVLEAGDLLAVPRHCIHSAEVVGEELVISLDAVRLG
jgi:mannose-6-phosphate isomerase-like protein (cupin superfamily)